MTKPSKHVIPRGYGMWAVRDSGAYRANRLFDTKDDAVAYARQAAQKAGVDLYIHGRGGEVELKETST